jgi:Fe-S-cluster-containing hydrogenase component 2
LTIAYALAGVDCVDVAADSAVLTATREALEVAVRLKVAAQQRGFVRGGIPWLMVSLNDGEDPHFRKAEIVPARCPDSCPRPCERVCPAEAIVFNQGDDQFSGVIDSRCYGCGRCVAVCPVQNIATRSYVFTPRAIAPLVLNGIDAVEIHTQVGRLSDFERLWGAIAPAVDHLKVVAISCPDGEGLVDYLWAIHDLISPLPCPVIWQTDGRPMSGDIGEGATHAAIKLGQKVLSAGLPGYIQLAGGTNNHTVAKLKRLGLLNLKASQNGVQKTSSLPHASSLCLTSSPEHLPYIAGVAYGSYARTLLSPVLDLLEKMSTDTTMSPLIQLLPGNEEHRDLDSIDSTLASSKLTARLESHPHLLWQAVQLADSLVSQLKSVWTHNPEHVP